MKVRIFVEGPSEKEALPFVLAHVVGGRQPITLLPLRGSRFLKDIGRTAAAILEAEEDAHVFACPDLAPKHSTRAAYDDHRGLQQVLTSQVRKAVHLSAKRLRRAIARFHPHPFRHDFEVLMLALPERLQVYLKTQDDVTKRYNAHRPEDQDFRRYPKRMVKELFKKHLKRDYDPVTDGRRFFESVTPSDVKKIVSRCPKFKALVRDLRTVLTG
jgi:hypothetical protein